MNRRYFFSDGIRFECIAGGACCTGAPRVVRSEARWQQAGRECFGIGQGRMYSEQEILDLLEGCDR